MTIFVNTWNSTYLTLPADSENASLGASRIRDFKNDLTARLQVDHSLAGDANDGAHIHLTLLQQAADPAAAATTGFLYTKAVGSATELFWEDAAGNKTQLTSGGVLTAGTATTSLKSGMPQNSQSVNYTTVLGDANDQILHPTADNNARTFTIDSNANVAFPIGTTLTFVNQINTLTIAITTDTLLWSPSGGTGSRTLAANGIATAFKIASTVWFISGVGLS